MTNFENQITEFRNILAHSEKQGWPLPGDDARRVAVELAAENERLRESLSLYATAWVTGCVGSANGQAGKRLLKDCGARARRALATNQFTEGTKS